MSQELLNKQDLDLFQEGNMFFSYNLLGAHPVKAKESTGIRFAVWAPHAKSVSVVGDFNNWCGLAHSMEKYSNGVWSLFVPGLGFGELYKYEITTKEGTNFLKADPYGFYSEVRPNTASITYSLDDYQWNDEEWINQKPFHPPYEAPINIYEVHLGSWKKEGDSFLSYEQLSETLIDYVADRGYTHIEILPLSEHPYDRSWGYQSTGFYSITSRYGQPKDFMKFIDKCHQRGIGVILDWVPGHFTKDAHGLRQFDGTTLFEYSEPERAESEWGSLYFDLGKKEVQSFLISNALFLLDYFHIDGLRVDAVSSLLYRDFGKKEGEWTPNKFGGRENLEAIDFLKKLNEVVFQFDPHTLMIAEESTAWPQVTSPTYLGGLGFNYKWNMGWMNDVLKYMELDPIYRKFHHELLTFSFYYAFSENYILALSHDEVVHGKKSLLNKMPGDYWQKFANLRSLLGYLIAHPGKKTLFMGAEFGQFIDWDDQKQLDWNLLDYDIHQSLHDYVKNLNTFYKQEPCLWQLDHESKGFEWIDPHNPNQSIITFMRKSVKDEIIILCNFTPMTYTNYRIGVPRKVVYQEVFSSDKKKYGGSGVENKKDLQAEAKNWHNQPYSLTLKIPPLGVVFIKEKTAKEGIL